MPYYQTFTYTNPGSATEPTINLDPSIAPFNAFILTTVTGTVSYKMQLSLNPMEDGDTNSIWVDSTDIPAGTTGGKSSALTVPWAKVRFVFASGTGSVVVQIRQGLSIN